MLHTSSLVGYYPVRLSIVFSVLYQPIGLRNLQVTGRLKTWDMTSRDWTMQHHIARVDIARLVSVFEWMLTTSLIYLMQKVLYCMHLLIGFMFVVLYLSVLLIAMCGRLSWPALWTAFGRTIK